MKTNSSKKRAYKKPVLQQHGSIKDLTKGGLFEPSQIVVGSDGSCPQGFSPSDDGQCFDPEY